MQVSGDCFFLSCVHMNRSFHLWKTLNRMSGNIQMFQTLFARWKNEKSFSHLRNINKNCLKYSKAFITSQCFRFWMKRSIEKWSSARFCVLQKSHTLIVIFDSKPRRMCRSTTSRSADQTRYSRITRH